MITSAIIPRPLAKLPWRLITLVCGIATFGLIVLYSAAGGHVQPWALKQAIVFTGFLGIAVGMSWMSERQKSSACGASRLSGTARREERGRRRRA